MVKTTYEIRVNFTVHPTQHLLVAEVEVRLSTFSSMETLFSIEGVPGDVSESHVKFLMDRAEALLEAYGEQWQEVNGSWDLNTLRFVTVER